MTADTINWKRVEDEMPDADVTVLIHAPDGGERVWLGWYDSEDACWREVGASEVEGVTHWADVPKGPTT